MSVRLDGNIQDPFQRASGLFENDAHVVDRRPCLGLAEHLVHKNPDFVADPSKGSRHNRGAAVDLTLIDLTTGLELAMPTPYDDFTSRARQDFANLPPEILANRARLREVMTRHGFEPLPSEWWHFDFKGWQRFELMDIGLDELVRVEGTRSKVGLGRTDTTAPPAGGGSARRSTESRK